MTPFFIFHKYQGRDMVISQRPRPVQPDCNPADQDPAVPPDSPLCTWYLRRYLLIGHAVEVPAGHSQEVGIIFQRGHSLLHHLDLVSLFFKRANLARII